jgi:hypothetical protein
LSRNGYGLGSGHKGSRDKSGGGEGDGGKDNKGSKGKLDKGKAGKGDKSDSENSQDGGKENPFDATQTERPTNTTQNVSHSVLQSCGAKFHEIDGNILGIETQLADMDCRIDRNQIDCIENLEDAKALREGGKTMQTQPSELQSHGPPPTSRHSQHTTGGLKFSPKNGARTRKT